jgi:hypothetical protein
MGQEFYTLHDFMLFTKGATYYLMGGIVLSVLGFWLYLTGRDEDTFIK